MDTQTHTHWFIWTWHTSRNDLAKYFFFPPLQPHVAEPDSQFN